MAQMQNNPMMQNIRNTVNLIKTAQNPYVLIENALAQKNPALVKAYNYINNDCGGDYKAAMNNLAAQYGMDGNAIMSMIK